MADIVKLLAVADLVLGLLALCVQISIYSIYPINGFGYWEASVGIWGAVILFLTAGLALKKSPKKQVQVMAGLSAATGVVMIGLFSWSMNDAITVINAFGLGCKIFSLCDAVAFAALFIVDGILVLIVNVVLFVKADD